MLPWSDIKTVLLDLDGTLLDLHFDNYFWLKFVPENYAKFKKIPLADATDYLMGRYKAVEGTMDWYCVEYWSDQLGLNIAQLKHDIQHLIRPHPDVPEFLQALRHKGKRVLLVTNAHQESLQLKLNKTGLAPYFDEVICSHAFGKPKEDLWFWRQFMAHHPFDRESALFIDDSLPVLRSAKQFGIRFLLAPTRPDSQNPHRDITEFMAFPDYASISTGLRHDVTD